MSIKPKIAITGGILLLLMVLLVCLVTGAYFYLPFYLESRIIPQLAADAGLSDFAVDVRNIGLFNADLGTLRIGPSQNPAVVIRSVQVDYSPPSLFQRKVEKITLGGLELHGELTKGRFKLRGIDMQKIVADAQRGQKTAAAAEESSFAVTLEKLEIRDSHVIIENNDQTHRIPFEIDMVPLDPEYEVFDVAAHVYPRGEKISATIKVNRPQRRAALRIDSAGLSLDRFADITARTTGLVLAGEMTLNGQAEVLWEPFQIASAKASLMLRHGKIAAAGLQLQTAMGANNEDMPFRLGLSAKNTHEWQISGSGLAMTAPAHLTLTGFDGLIKRNAAALESSGNFSAVLQASAPAGSERLPLKIQDPISLQGRFSARYHQSGTWQCEVANDKPEGAATETIRLDIDSYTLTSSIPEFTFSIQAAPQNIDAAYSLTAPAVRIASGGQSINIPKLLLKGTAKSNKVTDGSAEARFDLLAPDIAIDAQDGKIKISNLALTGKLNQNPDRQLSLESMLQFTGAGGRFSRFGVQFGGGRGKIPFTWPVRGKTAQGSISVTKLKYKGLALGRVSSQIRQTASGFAFTGRHQSTLLPRMKLTFSGESELLMDAAAGAAVHIKLSRPAAAPEIDLSKFHPDAAGIRINGKFELDGDVALKGDGISGQIRADFNNGNVWIGGNQQQMALEGIRMSLRFPELPNIRSAPGQQIRFAKISLGDFVAQKGRMDFQIESARSILIEKMRFLWCNGNVETQTIRLSPGKKDYHITFYCDRLNLAQVLEQFGAAAAEGQGSVNGRIPLQYAKGKIKFDDGFLYSTPGEGGKIRLSGTDILTAGIPPNTPQYVQMELAREALKDYDYAWAKLNITSIGEELLLQMQMDGKPSKTLPFVYKKDVGGFMKVEADAKGSKFQGIRLDVNFRLPLNKLLQYKDLINMIQ